MVNKYLEIIGQCVSFETKPGKYVNCIVLIDFNELISIIE